MIAPLPPQHGLPQPSADIAPAKSDPRADADGFAEILAAAAAAVPAPRLPGPPPSLEHGPATMRIADLVPAEPAAPAETVVETPAQLPLQAALTDPTGETGAPRPDRPQPAARVFNQDGFFGTSVDGAATDAIPAVAADPAAAAAAMPGPGAGIAQLPDDLPAEQPRTATGAMPAPAEGAGETAHAAALPRLSHIRSGPSAAPAAARPIAFAADAEAEIEPVKPLARRLATREPAARAAVQVAMRELEQGLHVAARAEGLDAAERVRLHDEIAALLARHGLSARRIRISAPQRQTTSEERLK